MVRGDSREEVWNSILSYYSDFAGRQLSVNQEVYKSESDTNQRNQAIGKLMCAYERIKADPELRSIPIIVVTSYALSGDEDKARLAGCDDYVAKPFSPRQRLAKIKQYV